jgi:NtrC-family two-component system sensor histidine kinase KinB
MLRTKVMLGLCCLLIIMFAMGLFSIDRCSDLGRRIVAIDRDHNGVGQAIGEMKRSCGAMTGALLVRATDGVTPSTEDFDAAWVKWSAALGKVQADAAHRPDEKKIVDQILTTSATYHARARAFLQSPGLLDMSGRRIGQALGAETMQMLGHCDELGLAHQKELTTSGHEMGESITETVRLLCFLMLLACVVAIAASMGLTRGLLNPLASMAVSIQKVGEGNLDQKLPVLSRDEFGMLATSFNKMAEQLKTYRANTSEELLRLNRTIRSTLASFPDPIFVLNSEGTVEFRNPEADQLALKLLFAGVTRLPRKVDEQVEKVLATGEDFLPTLFADKGATFGVAVILENVTRMLLLDDVKSNLISTVSHELKTPLTSVRMALYLLVEKTVGPLNEKQHDLVLTAREDADRLLRTLNDLLDLAKLEQGPALLDLRPVSPAKLVENAAYAVREPAAAANIRVTIEVVPKLPEIRLDQQRIAYVFANFLTNAIKYSPGDTEVHVKAGLGETRSGRASVRFSVRDQGAGIAPEHQERLFERFYRVPGTNKSGAGLGLSIAREIVAAHGGEIGVLSTPGEGTEFFFVIPIESIPAGRNDLI